MVFGFVEATWSHAEFVRNYRTHLYPIFEHALSSGITMVLFFLILIFHLLQNFRDVVLEHLYQSFSDDEGGVQGCIREALLSHPEMDRATTVKVGAAPNFLVLDIMGFPSLFFLLLQKKFSSVCLCCRD